MATPHLVNAVVRDNALVTKHVQLVIDTHRTSIRSAAVKGQKVVLTDFGSFEVASRRKGRWGNSGSNTSTAQSAWRTYPSLARLALARVGLDALPIVLATVTYAPHRSSRRITLGEVELPGAPLRPTRPATVNEGMLDELDKRNMLRVLAHWRRIEGRSLSSSQLQRHFGVTRQRLHQLRAERKLVGLRLPLRREVYYPLWQFAADGTPLEMLPRLLDTAAEAHIDLLALDALMMSEEAGDGTTPAELLRRHEDEYVLALVRAAFAHGA